MEESFKQVGEFFADLSPYDVLELEGFIKEGFDVNKSLLLEDGRRPLHVAAIKGNVYMVHQLLLYGAKVDVRDYCGNTSLHHASREGHIQVVQLLLNREADPNLTNDDGHTILQNAVSFKHFEIMRLLLSKGANLNALISYYPPQHSIHSVSGVDLVILDDIKRTTLLTWAFEQVDLPLINLLLDAGANVKNVNVLWYIAIKKNNIELVELLVDKGADFRVKFSRNVNHPLNFAVGLGNCEIVEMLLNRKDDWIVIWPNSEFARSEDGFARCLSNAFKIAIDNGQLKMAKCLLERGAQISDDLMSSALENTLMNGYNDVAEWLFNRGVHLNVPASWYSDLLDKVIARGNHETIKLILCRGVDFNIQKEKISNTLISATKNKLVPIIELLLDKGANMNHFDIFKNTALYYAIKDNESTDIFKIFLSRGALVNDFLNVESKTTALHMAVSLRQTTLVEFLLKEGANVNAKDNSGLTPCHELFKYGFHDDFFTAFAKRFVAQGADLTCTNNEGETPIEFAMKGRFWSPLKKTMDDSGRLLLEEYFEVVKENETHIKQFAITLLEKKYSSLGKVVLSKVVEYYFQGATLSCKTVDLKTTNKMVSGSIDSLERNGQVTDLHVAAFYGDIYLADLVLQSGVSIDAVTEEQFTPLQVALYKNNTEMAQHLINRGANVDIRDKLGLLPIQVAFLTGEITLVEHLYVKTLNQKHELVNFLLENGIYINAQHENGGTVFYSAFLPLRLLDTECKFVSLTHSRRYWTPPFTEPTEPHLLSWFFPNPQWYGSAYSGSSLYAPDPYFPRKYLRPPVDLVSWFINHGADINCCPEFPPYSTLNRRMKDVLGIFFLRTLLTNKRVDIKNIEEELHKVKLASILCYHEITRVFLEMSCDPEDQMSQRKRTNFMQILLNQGFTMKPDSKLYHSLLTNLMEEINFDPFQVVLRKDQMLNLQLVLTRAVLESNRKCIIAILDKMDVNINDKSLVDRFFSTKRMKHGLAQIFLDRMKVTEGVENCELLVQMAKAGNSSIVETLLDKGVYIHSVDDLRNTAVNYAVASGNERLLCVLLDKGADVNHLNKINETPVYIAAKEGHVNILKMLIDKGAIVTVTDVDGNTPLHRTKSCNAAEILINEGVSVNAQNSSKQTALHSVIDFDSHFLVGEIGKNKDVPKTTALLINKGAVVNVQDKNGMTPLHLAAKKGYLITSTVLIERGANINSKDHNGQTALHHAVIKGNREIVECLLNEGAEINVKDDVGNTPYSIQPTPIFLQSKQIFHKFTLKMKLADLPFDGSIPSSSTSEEEASCTEELNKIKSTQISNTFILYQILKSSFHQPVYLIDEQLEESIQSLFSSGFLCQFPNYKGILRSTFRRFCLTRRAIDSMFCENRREFCHSLPVEMWLLVFRLLNTEDLFSIIESGSN